MAEVDDKKKHMSPLSQILGVPGPRKRSMSEKGDAPLEKKIKTEDGGPAEPEGAPQLNHTTEPSNPEPRPKHEPSNQQPSEVEEPQELQQPPEQPEQKPVPASAAADEEEQPQQQDAVPEQSDAEKVPEAPQERPAAEKEPQTAGSETATEAAEPEKPTDEVDQPAETAAVEEPSKPAKEISPVPATTVDSSNVLDSVKHFEEFVSKTVVYEPGKLLFGPAEEHLNSIVWVRIARRYLTRNNPGVLQRKLWGTEVYTDDSDIVSALYHTDQLLENENDLIVKVKLLPRLKKYQGSFHNELNSRTWNAHHDGVSFTIVGVECLPRGSAEYPVSEAIDRVRQWGLAYIQQRDVRATTLGILEKL